MNKLGRFTVSTLAAIASFVVVLRISEYAFFDYALKHHGHPGSMVGFWAWYRSLPIAAGASMVVFVGLWLLLLKTKKP